MRYLLSLVLFLASTSAYPYLDHKQVVKEFNEDGHIPQGLKKKHYHKLEEVIPLHIQKEIREKKEKKKKEKKQLDQGLMIESEQLPLSMDMRKYDSPIRNQWDGTCTAHGLIAGMENLYNRQKNTLISVRYFWSQYKQYSADVAINTALNFKQIDEPLWPENSVNPIGKDLATQAKYKLATEEYLGDDTNKVIQSLAQGYPVYVAMSVPQDMAACRSSIRYTTGVTTGGHALAIVGYQFDKSVAGGVYVTIKNSWGTDCGDSGYQHFPLTLCNKRSMYCVFWALKAVQ